MGFSFDYLIIQKICLEVSSVIKTGNTLAEDLGLDPIVHVGMFTVRPL